MLSAGIDYSQNGGFSVNAGGFSYGNGGLSFNPSVGVSVTAKWGSDYLKGKDNIQVDENDKSGKPNVSYGDNEGINKLADSWMKRPKNLISIYADGTGGVGPKEGEYVYGKIEYLGFSSKIYLAEGAFKSNAFLYLILQHEYSHLILNNRGYNDKDKPNNEGSNEYTAWRVTFSQAYQWSLYGYLNDLIYPMLDYYKNQQYGTLLCNPYSIMTIRKGMP
jgi:hypothetical protein